MARTLATKKQSEAIRHQMLHVRNRLPYDVDVARARARQLSDWKYHMRRRPWPVLAAAAAVGFVLIPRKHKSKKQVVVHHTPEKGKPASKKGVVGGAVGALATMALRSGASLATRHLSDTLLKQASKPDRRREVETPYQTQR